MEKDLQLKSLKEEALNYEYKGIFNIADLPKVSINMKVEERQGVTKDGKLFNFKVIQINGQYYRVPLSVLKSLKAILEHNPNLKEFKVKKSGEGLNGTQYTTIPL